MDFGIIAPFKFMPEVAAFSNTSMYLYHLFENSWYSEFFQKDKNYRILDNGVFELTQLPSDEEYIEKIISLSPEEIIAPDIPNNYSDTCKRANNFAEKYRAILNKIKLQGVIQATNLNDAIKCYIFYLNNPFIDVIGFPYRIEIRIDGDLGGRKELIELLNNEGLLGQKPIHLLGLKSIDEVIKIARTGKVRSCDSSKFYRHASEGIYYDKEYPSNNVYGNLDFHEAYSKDCINLIKMNLEVLRCEIKR